jgi:hypothetical protein
VLLGLSEESKAYRLYDLVEKKIVISRDVVFDEEKSWDWDQSYNEQLVADLECGDEGDTGTSMNEEDIPEELEHGADTNEDLTASFQPGENRGESSSFHENLLGSPQPSENSRASPGYYGGSSQHGENRGESSVFHERRVRGPPRWIKDYVTGKLSEEKDANVNLILFTSTDPVQFEDAVKYEHWRTTMDIEIKAIERNNTWELTDMPADAKKIEVKWVYKTKFKEDGEVDKFKA